MADLAAKNLEKLKELRALFLTEAAKNRALPLDDRLTERFNAALVGRPDLMDGRTSLTVFDGMIGMTENVFINTKNRSHTITAEVTIPKSGANGGILSRADASAGGACTSGTASRCLPTTTSVSAGPKSHHRRRYPKAR